MNCRRETPLLPVIQDENLAHRLPHSSLYLLVEYTLSGGSPSDDGTITVYIDPV